MDEFDVVVVGGGAAGLSAALVLSRARRQVLVVDAGTPRNAPAAHMHGFLTRDGTPPQQLLGIGREEVSGYGGDIREAAVAEIDRSDASDFQLRLTDGETVSARRLVIATGLRDELPDIPGARERWGIDLLHCPYCHGYEVRDQPLGVIGNTPDATWLAQLVRQWSADVMYFAHTDLGVRERGQLDSRGIHVMTGPVTRLIIEADRLTGVELQDGSVVERAAVFVRPRLMPNADLLQRLGCATDEDGWVKADETGETSVRGVWVAGNISNPRAQVITAAGEGVTAAMAVNADLVDEDIARAVQSPVSDGSE